MTSKIVVNNIEADAGVSTVTFNSNVERGSSNLHSTGLNVNNTFVHSTGIALGAGSTIGAVTGVTTYFGDGSQLTGISAGTALSGSTNNTVTTVTGANAITGEANLKFDGGGTLTIVDTELNESSDNFSINIQSGNNDFYVKSGGTTFAAFKGQSKDLQLTSGNLVIGTSGKGIDFSATSDASGSSNELLDDYEEGSWTPTMEGLSNTPTYHNRGGIYTKIGNRVWLQGHIQIASTKPQFSNQSAIFKISGLPFTGQGLAGTGYFMTHGVVLWQQLDWVGGTQSSYGHSDDTQMSPGIVDAGTRITFQTCGQGIYYVGQMLNRAFHDDRSWNLEWTMSYRTAT